MKALLGHQREQLVSMKFHRNRIIRTFWKGICWWLSSKKCPLWFIPQLASLWSFRFSDHSKFHWGGGGRKFLCFRNFISHWKKRLLKRLSVGLMRAECSKSRKKHLILAANSYCGFCSPSVPPSFAIHSSTLPQSKFLDWYFLIYFKHFASTLLTPHGMFGFGLR